ncbi:MAG: zinc ribbon domain-containing protein [Clostridiales bacterium]|nr:zinc ribbon domain-containing protein [Clostridiales bacterium]
MKSRYTPPLSANRELKNPLAGLMYCGICGTAMTRISTGTGDFLKCSRPGCKNTAVKTDLAEKAVAESLKPVLKGYRLNLKNPRKKVEV